LAGRGEGKNSITPNDIMVSTLTAVNLQLRSGLTIANCCSNFHNFIREVRKYAGCGEVNVESMEWVCLDQLEGELEPLKICCFHNKNSGKCKSEANHTVGVDHLVTNRRRLEWLESE